MERRCRQNGYHNVEPGDLRVAWLGLVARAGTHRHHTVGRQELSVREAMGQIAGCIADW